MKVNEKIIMKNSFETLVYNEGVRQAVCSKKYHPGFEVKWADTHFILMRAHTEDEALAQYQRQYPLRLGFVHGKIAGVF